MEVKPENTTENKPQEDPESQDEVVVKEETIDNSREEEHVDTNKAESQNKHSFFLFVNPKSGGNKAAKLTKLDVQKMLFNKDSPDEDNIELFIYDMTNSQNRELGLTVLKKKQEKGKHNLYVIVGGGDGTVLWVIDELIRAQIDFSKCPIGVIPFGTGNDFSRVLGWGGAEPPHLIGTHVEGLKVQAKEWLRANVEDFDIWDVTIETYDYGGLTHISKAKGAKFEKKYLTIVNPETKEETRAYSFSRKMSNYFSFGVDSRIGYDFDKRRTQSQLENKFVYAWEGAKQLFTKKIMVNDVLEAMDQVNDDEGEEKNQETAAQVKAHEMVENATPVKEASPVREEVRVEDTKKPEEVVEKQVQKDIQKQAEERKESSNEKQAEKQEEIVVVEENPGRDQGIKTQEGFVKEDFRLLPSSSLKEKVAASEAKVTVMQGNHVVFLCLNIPSYMGGASDPWAASKGRVGVTQDSKVLPDFEDQNFGDGKLELLGFKKALSLAMERVRHGRGWRLGQVRGPFILNFKVSKDPNHPLHSYMQIDGEFYDVIAPKTVRVSLSKDIPHGKIKVLQSTEGKKPNIVGKIQEHHENHHQNHEHHHRHLPHLPGHHHKEETEPKQGA